MMRRFLLGCGVLSSLLYAAMTVLVASSGMRTDLLFNPLPGLAVYVRTGNHAWHSV
ncbi:MAG TPA: hypothetical protein VFI56_16665 [Vicinamibacterales bacterium]|nr:hypothetical protein [Vicinamibacterales bacterium]